jgi:methylphosphotriester-DNA--protein-cysteine methyltransferase
MNSARPTKKATPTSKKEGDQPIVEAAAKLLANDNSGGWMRLICRQCGSDVSPHHPLDKDAPAAARRKPIAKSQ